MTVVRVSLCSFLFVFVSVEAFLVFAVFCVIETSLDKEEVVAIIPVMGVVVKEAESFLVFAVFFVFETSLDKEGRVAILPVIGVVAEETSTVVFPSIVDFAENVEETASVVFPSIIVFAVDVLDILGFRWQISNPPFVSVVFSPV